MEACFEGGANRFSLGVQSFDTEIRQAMGRVSDRDTLIRQLQLLQSYDQAAVIVDLIYGFPMQTMERWLADIATAPVSYTHLPYSFPSSPRRRTGLPWASAAVQRGKSFLII